MTNDIPSDKDVALRVLIENTGKEPAEHLQERAEGQTDEVPGICTTCQATFKVDFDTREALCPACGCYSFNSILVLANLA